MYFAHYALELNQEALCLRWLVIRYHSNVPRTIEGIKLKLSKLLLLLLLLLQLAKSIIVLRLEEHLTLFLLIFF